MHRHHTDVRPNIRVTFYTDFHTEFRSHTHILTTIQTQEARKSQRGANNPRDMRLTASVVWRRFGGQEGRMLWLCVVRGLFVFPMMRRPQRLESPCEKFGAQRPGRRPLLTCRNASTRTGVFLSWAKVGHFTGSETAFSDPKFSGTLLCLIAQVKTESFF